MAGKPRFITLDDVDLAGKRVLARVDFNVPIKDGKVTDDTRIRASLPTIEKITAAGGMLTLMSHLGRPKSGQFDPASSLQPVAERLSMLISRKVELVPDWSRRQPFEQGKVIMMENVRFLAGETDNDDGLAREMAALCDVYVNDAFAAAHRAHASTHGVAKFAPVACAGPLIVREMEALTAAFEKPARPLVAVVGGAKVSTKLEVLRSLVQKVDQLILGGGIANTFLKAAGTGIGKSLCEDELVQTAVEIMAAAEKAGKSIPLPEDVVCAKSLDESARASVRPVTGVEADDLILDIGPKTANLYAGLLRQAKTVIWNGPVGVFEIDQFSEGTRAVARAVAASGAFSVAGGGDTIAAISRFGVADDISYITTAGGAFLEFLEGKTLPAIAMLRERARLKES